MPRHSQAPIRGASLALALLLATGQGLAADTAPVEKELDGVRKALEFGRAAEALRQQETAKIAAEVRKLQQKLVVAASQSRDLEQSVAKAEERLSTLLVRSEAARYNLQSREAEVAATLRAMIRLQRQPPSALLLHNDSIVGAARSNRLLTKAVPYLREDTAGLRSELIALAALRQETDAERERLDGAVKELEVQRAAMAALLRQRRDQVRRLSGDSKREQERLRSLARRADNLSGLLSQLHEEEAQRRADEERRARIAAAERARREAEHRAARAVAQAQAEAEEKERRQAARKQADVAPRLAFSAARGRLTLPVHGRIIRKYGQRDEVGAHSQGLTLLTRADAEVVAPHDGRIAFSGPFRDYGVILIIAHGEGYHTLLAGLAETYVEVGQALLAGEPVGHMGNGKNRTLYVELRRNGEAINPHPWWASNGGKVSG